MYVPMGGLIMAFQDFKPNLGFFKSEFNRFANFDSIFTTLGTFLNIVLAIAIDQFVFKRAAKVM